MMETTVHWLHNKTFVGIDSSKHAIVLSTQDEGNAVGNKPSELLLLALGSCVAVDVVDILAKKRMPVEALEIRVSGEQEPEPPWTFRRFHLSFRLRGPGLTPDAVERTIRLAERKYCSVSATIRATAEITWDYEIESLAQPAN
jgi:putative redox protein